MAALAADSMEEDCPAFTIDRRDDYATSVLRTLGTFKQNGELTDIDVKLEGGKKVSCHKLLLAAASPYIKGAVTYDAPTSLDLTFHDGDVVEAILEYVYSGLLRVADHHLLPHLLCTADFLQMQEVKEECAEYLATNITPRLSVTLFPLAGRMGLGALQYACLDTIALYFPSLAHQEELLEFDHEEMRYVLEVDNLHATSEDQVLDVIIRWFLHDPDNRAQHFERLLQFVKIIHCSNVILAAIEATKKPEYRTIKQAIKRRLKYLNGIERLPGIRSTLQKESIFLVGGENTDDGGPIDFIYAAQVWPQKEPQFDRFTDLPFADETRGYGVSLFPHGLVVTGGCQRGTSTDSTYLFQFCTRKWSPLPPMLTPRDGHVSVSYGVSAAIVAGGGASTEESGGPGRIALDSVHRLDLAEMRWERMRSVQQHAYGVHCGAVCGDHLYLLADTPTPGAPTGGGGTLLHCDLTTTTGDAWQVKRKLPTRGAEVAGGGGGGGLALVAMLERLYLVDGWAPGLWKYLAEQDAWERLATPPLTCRLGAGVYWRGHLYYGGGGWEEMEEYSVRKNEWKQWENTRFRLPRHSRAHCFLAGAHYG